MKKLFDLFFTFFKIGLFTFGGGYAMIPLIEDKCVEKKKWITHDEMMNLTVIAETTPGPIAINSSTFIGYRIAGIPGSIAATLGVTLPSLIIIYLISMFFDNFLSIGIVAKAFKGIKIAVGLLILRAGINMMKKTDKKPFPITVLIVSFCLMTAVNIFSVNLSSIVLMLTAALTSFIIFLIGKVSKKKGGEAK